MSVESLTHIGSFNGTPTPGIDLRWDDEHRELTFTFSPDFWNKEKQNTLTTAFEGEIVSVHEANIRHMVRQLQHVANTGKIKEIS